MVPLGFLALIASTGVFLWPLMVRVLFEQDSIKAGWLSSAPLITGVFVAPVFGWMFQKFGYQSNWIITCLAASLTLLTAVQAVVSKSISRVTPSSKATLAKLTFPPPPSS
jgi:MFS family permease